MRLPYKKWLAKAWVQKVVAAPIIAYLWLLCCGIRWRTIDEVGGSKAVGAGKTAIICFWHNRIILMPSFRMRYRDFPFAMLSTPHRDGQLIARAYQRFHMGTVWGTRSKNKGTGAFRGMLSALKQGTSMGITLDGPKGPRYHATIGAVALAARTGAPLVPIAIAARHGRFLNTWDRLILAWPFGEGVFVWGEPLYVPANADAVQLEAYRLALQERLRALTLDADALMRLPRVEPADVNAV